MFWTWLNSNHAKVGLTLVAGRPAEVAERMTTAMEGNPAWKAQWQVLSCCETDGVIQIHATRTTRVFRFVDDIHVKLSSPDHSSTQSAVRATSRSRVGKGDFGQNARNLAQLMNGIQSVPAE